MDYAVIFRWKSESTGGRGDAAMMLRERLKEHTNVEILAEYGLDAEDIAAVWIVRAEDRVALMEIEVAYGDAFDISVLPAASSEGFERGW